MYTICFLGFAITWAVKNSDRNKKIMEIWGCGVLEKINGSLEVPVSKTPPFEKNGISDEKFGMIITALALKIAKELLTSNFFNPQTMIKKSVIGKIKSDATNAYSTDPGINDRIEIGMILATSLTNGEGLSRYSQV